MSADTVDIKNKGVPQNSSNHERRERTHNPLVPGSSPGGPTTTSLDRLDSALCSHGGTAKWRSRLDNNYSTTA